MVMSHSSYASNSNAHNLGKVKMFTVKEDLYKNDAGDIKASKDGLPKGWAKGKLLARKGMEISDAQAKEWALNKASTKAKAPKENK